MKSERTNGLAILFAVCLVPILAGCAPLRATTLPEPARSRSDQIAKLADCSPSIPARIIGDEKSWRIPASQADQHAALWARLGEEMPQHPNQILIFNVAAHHTTKTWSLVATRVEDGFWAVEQIGEATSGFFQVDPRNRRQRAHWILTPEQGRIVDRLLADECLALEPSGALDFDTLGVGATFWTMDIKTPGLVRTIASAGRGVGVSGLLAQTLWESGRGESDR